MRIQLSWKNWEEVERKGRFKEGGHWKNRVRTRQAAAPPLCFEEGIILESSSFDKGGNETHDQYVGYHYLALLLNGKQIYFAFAFPGGWRILSDDAVSYVRDYSSMSAALGDLIEKAEEERGIYILKRS